jgi:hypothetical protein
MKPWGIRIKIKKLYTAPHWNEKLDPDPH